MKNVSLIVVVLFLFGNSSLGQTFNQRDLKSEFDRLLTKEMNTYRASLKTVNMHSIDSYQFMGLRAVLGSLNAVGFAPENLNYIQLQVELVDAIIGSAKKSRLITGNITFRDNYLGWGSLTTSKIGTQEVSLYEGYIFFYIVEFLYKVRSTDWYMSSNSHRKWVEDKLKFIEQNIWRKWEERSMKTYNNADKFFLRTRTHMGAHWAGVALYLERLTTNWEDKAVYKSVYSKYNELLRKQLQKSPLDDDAMVWNSDYENSSKNKAERRSKIVQDVSHGNHVISYIIAAYELNSDNWSLADIRSLCDIVKRRLYDEKKNEFSDNVDGTKDYSRPGWGNFQADGWIKLAKYDRDVYQIYKQFGTNSRLLKKYNQRLQYVASLLALKSIYYNEP